MEKGFTQLVKEHFDFLLAEYGFSVANENENARTYGDRLVEFRSASTVVIISDEPRLVAVDIGPVSEPRIARHGLWSIVKFFAPHEYLALSTMPPELSKSYDKRVQYQLAKFASTVKQYCVPFLRGDFSKWIDLEESIIERTNSEYKARTGRDLPETPLDAYVRAKKMKSSKNQAL